MSFVPEHAAAEGRRGETAGRHLLAEYVGCDAAPLNDCAAVREALRAAAQAAGATVVAEVVRPFAPHGVSGVLVIEESHLSIHTWPERGYAAVDFYTCGDCEPDRAHVVLHERLGATRSELLLVERGRLDRPHLLGVASHQTDPEAQRSSSTARGCTTGVR